MRRDLAINLAIIAVLIGAAIYPPIASLLGDGIRALAGLGAVGGGVYLICRYPWDALLWTVGIGFFVGSIVLLLHVTQTSGSLAGGVAYFGSTWIMWQVCARLGLWIDQKKKS